jgi:hypothetical protein
MIFLWLWIGFMAGVGVMCLVQINHKPDKKDPYEVWE